MAKYPFKKGDKVIFNSNMEELQEGLIKAGSRGVVLKRTTVSRLPEVIMYHYQHENGSILFDIGGVCAFKAN